MVFKCFNCNSSENLFAAPQTHEMREKWLELFPEGDVNIFNDSFRICAEHFDNKYIMPTGVLSARAVPTKFLVHNVWCEIEDINDEQQDNQMEISTVSSQPLENDSNQSQQDMSPTAPEVLMDYYTDEMSGSFVDTLYSSRSQEPRIAPVQITSKHTSTPIASHQSGKGTATFNLIPKKSRERIAPLVNNVQQRQNSDSDLRMKLEGIFSGADSLGSTHVSPSLATYQNVAGSRVFIHSLNSSYPANGTFSPMTNTTKLLSDHTTLKRSPNTSLFTSKSSIFNNPDALSKKTLTPEKKPTLDTPKASFFDVRNSHRKRVKFNTSDEIVPFHETQIKAHKICRNQPQKSAKGEWEESEKSLFSYEKMSKSQSTKVRNEASYATKRRKKVPIVLLKRLKFPNNMMPPLGTLLNIGMLEQLNTFQVDGTAARSNKKPAQNDLLGMPNGLFGPNRSAPSLTVVDLTLDDDSSEPEVDHAITAPPTPPTLRSPTAPRSSLALRTPPTPHTPPPMPRIPAKPVTALPPPKSVKKIKRVPHSPRVVYIPPNANGNNINVSNSIDDKPEPAPVSNKLSNSFEVRQDVPLSDQLKLYQAELQRVRSVQMSLYKHYSAHATRFKKLQKFLDQLAKSGLIMKRDDE